MRHKDDTETVPGRILRQTVYDHGGSRISLETPGGTRDLIAESYTDENFADALLSFVTQWLLTHRT